MKASDIKPGVVYAWHDGRADYHTIMPVMFLEQPGPATLWTSPRNYGHRDKDEPIYVRVTPGKFARPKEAQSYSNVVGYAAVGITSRFSFGSGNKDNIERAVKWLRESKFTIENFAACTQREATGGTDHDVLGTEFRPFPTLAKVIGEWDQVVAERKDKADAKEAAEKLAAQRKADMDARWSVVRTALGTVIGDGKPLAGYRVYDGRLGLGIEEAEALVSVLEVARAALLDENGEIK